MKDVEGRRNKMRSNDHETRFCRSIGDGLHRRVDARLCPRGAWAWWRVCEPWRLGAGSYHSLGITRAADARFLKPDSRPPPGTRPAPRHHRAVGAEPVRVSYVGAVRRSQIGVISIW